MKSAKTKRAPVAKPKVPANAGRNAVTRIAIVPDTERVLVAYADGMIRVWDATAAKLTREVKLHAAAIEAMTVLPGGELAVSSGKDATFVAWAIATGKAVRREDRDEDDVIGYIFPWTDASRVVIHGYTDTSLRVWNVATGETIALERESEDYMESVVVRTGEVVAEDGNVVVIWKLASPKQPHSSHVLGGFGTTSLSADGRVAFKPPGEFDDPDAGTVNVWDTASGKKLKTVKISSEPIGATFDPAFKRFTRFRRKSPKSDGYLEIWDIAKAAPIVTLEVTLERHHPNVIVHQRWSPNGRLLATTSQDANRRADDRRPPWERTGVACVWDVAKAACLARWELPAVVQAIEVTRGGCVVVGLYDGTVQFLHMPKQPRT